jgi:hypothetical protein
MCGWKGNLHALAEVKEYIPTNTTTKKSALPTGRSVPAIP